MCDHEFTIWLMNEALTKWERKCTLCGHKETKPVFKEKCIIYESEDEDGNSNLQESESNTSN